MTDVAQTTSSGPTPAGAPASRPDLLLVVLMLALYTPLIFFGYGSDNDSYLVLDSGRALVEEHRYVPSRNPGYLLFEAAVGVLSRVGGSPLCNAVTLATAVATLLLFLRVCRELDVPRRHLLGLLFVLHPVVWVNSTCTMDYMWALALLMAGQLLVIRRAYLAAGILLALAIGVRSTSFIAAGLVLAFPLAGRREDRAKVLSAGVTAVVLGALFYIPSFRHAGYTLEFLRPMIGGDEYWTTPLRLAKFAYKNLYFWGLPAAMMLPVLLLLGRRAISDRRRRGVVLACAAVVAAYEALFLRFPLEPGYLLPVVPAVLILLGIALAERPVALAAFAAALAVSAVVNFNIARPDNPRRATGGSVGLWVEPGLVRADVRWRMALRHCDSYECWENVIGAGGGPEHDGSGSGRQRE